MRERVVVTKAWLYSFGALSDLQAEVAGRLAAAGVETYPFRGTALSGPGIVCFEEFSDDLNAFIGEVSRGGRERILALTRVSRAAANKHAWALLRCGASDLIVWDQGTERARDAAARLERWAEVARLMQSAEVSDHIAGDSPMWRDVLRQVVEVARFTDASVLITGESGTGKELVARVIHTLDSRVGKRDLVVLDCATVVPTLSGSEFFGHERGSFTGAVSTRDGAFALANGGTLFLDEIGELPAHLQAELLRVIQEGMYKRVGSNAWQRTSFRLICATNRSLLSEAAQGGFRRDLYYRIAGWACRLPALRERTEDILPLAEHFIRVLRPGVEPPRIDDAVRDFLLRREYPGNIRELRNLVARILHRHVGSGPITLGDIPDDERPAPDFPVPDWRDSGFQLSIRRALDLGVPLREIANGAADTAIRVAMLAHDGNLRRAAHQLGVTDRALQLRRAATRQRRTHGVDASSR